MAELFFDSYEFPWIEVSVTACRGMEPFWRNFDDPETWPEDDPTVEAMLAEIDRRGGFVLVPERAASTKHFTLVNFDGQHGNLRYDVTDMA